MDKKIIKATAVWLGLLLCMQSAVAADQARISKAVLGTGATPTYEIINPGSEFAPDTAKIYCAWKAEGIAAHTQVRGAWIAEDVGTAAKPNFKIDEATFTSQTAGTAVGAFALNKPNRGFPVGKYRLEIYLGQTLAKTVPFTVKAK